MAVVNLKELKEIMDNDMELIQDCFDDFLADWPDMFADIRTAVANMDYNDINETAHRFKGTLKYLAAEEAADAAMAIEKAGNQSDPDNIDAKLADLEKACLDLVDYIKAFNS